MMNWKQGLVLGAIAATLGLTACGSDSGGGSTGPDKNAVQPGGLCQRLAEIQCAGEQACCTDPGRTEADCITAQKNACTQTLNFDTVAADPIAGFDAARAKAAFDAFEQKANACDPTVAAFAVSPTGLRGIAQGTVAAGGACDPANMSNVATIAAALASCAGPATQACLPSASAWTCAPLAAAGGACFTDVNCQEGLYCNNPTLNLAGDTCQARKADGATCTLPNECTGFLCQGGVCVSGQQAAYCLMTP